MKYFARKSSSTARAHSVHTASVRLHQVAVSVMLGGRKAAVRLTLAAPCVRLAIGAHVVHNAQ